MNTALFYCIEPILKRYKNGDIDGTCERSLASSEYLVKGICIGIAHLKIQFLVKFWCACKIKYQKHKPHKTNATTLSLEKRDHIGNM